MYRRTAGGKSKGQKMALHGQRGAAVRVVRRAAAPSTGSSATSTFSIQSKIAYLQEDLGHLFDERGIDPDGYEAVVDFKDPITKYENLDGYLFNIQFLKKAFNPKFELHETWVSDPQSVTTRWTMTMEFTATQAIPVVRDVFKPTIIFTGTSTYVFNPESGKIFRHIDTWDSISNQDFFSFEGFGDFLKQLLAPYTTPSLETPPYVVLKRCKDYQIRRYEPFTVAECAMDEAAPSGTNPAGPGKSAFGELAGYIFGRNQQGKKMAMTTPVYADTTGVMQFYIGGGQAGQQAALDSLPSPASCNVRLTSNGGGVFAVRLFNGVASPDSASQEQQALVGSLQRDGVVPSCPRGADWTLARYNDPGTPALLRRNEVLVPLNEAAFMSSWP